MLEGRCDAAAHDGLRSAGLLADVNLRRARAGTHAPQAPVPQYVHDRRHVSRKRQSHRHWPVAWAAAV